MKVIIIIIIIVVFFFFAISINTSMASKFTPASPLPAIMGLPEKAVVVSPSTTISTAVGSIFSPKRSPFISPRSPALTATITRRSTPTESRLSSSKDRTEIPRSQPVDIPGAYSWEEEVLKGIMPGEYLPADFVLAPARVHHRKDNVTDYYRSRHESRNSEGEQVFYKGAYQPLFTTNPWEDFHSRRLRGAKSNIGKKIPFNKRPVKLTRLPAKKLLKKQRVKVSKRVVEGIEMVPKVVPYIRNIRQQNMDTWAAAHPLDNFIIDDSGCYRR